MNLGEAITRERRRQGLKQKELAEMAHITPVYMGKIERGLTVPSVQVLVGISAALGVGIDELTGTGKCADVAELKAANERLGRQLHAAQRDLALLDSCEVCGWNDNGSCRNKNKKSGSCFAWRGAERARLWEDT